VLKAGPVPGEATPRLVLAPGFLEALVCLCTSPKCARQLLVGFSHIALGSVELLRRIAMTGRGLLVASPSVAHQHLGQLRRSLRRQEELGRLVGRLLGGSAPLVGVSPSGGGSLGPGAG